MFILFPIVLGSLTLLSFALSSPLKMSQKTSGKKMRFITPETVTDADLVELKLTRAEFDQKVQSFTLTKALLPLHPELQMPLYQIGFPLKSPCKPRTPEWFAKNKDRILAEANNTLEIRHQKKAFDSTYTFFNTDVREAIFKQIVLIYQHLAESQSTHINILNGCCSNADRCIYPAFQHCLLVAMRHLD